MPVIHNTQKSKHFAELIENKSEQILETYIHTLLQSVSFDNQVLLSKPVLLDEHSVGIIAIGYGSVIAWRSRIENIPERIKKIPSLLKSAPLTSKERAMKAIPRDNLLVAGMRLYGLEFFEGIEDLLKASTE